MRVRLLLLVLFLLLLPEWVAAQGGPRSLTVYDTLPNDTTTGTIKGRLAKRVPGTGTQSKLILATTADTTLDLYVVTATQGTTGEAQYVVQGRTDCEMDGTNAVDTADWYVVNSGLVNGQCHAQSTPPANGMVVGKMIDNRTTIGVRAKVLANNQAYKPGSGGGTGSVTSIQVAVPPEWTSTGGPITAAGTITIGKATQLQNLAWLSPNGAPGAPTFRAIVAADLPAGTAVGAAGGDLGGTYPNPSVLQASGAFAWTGLNNVTLAGDANDYSPAGLATTTVLAIDGGTADRNFTGLAGCTTSGRQMLVRNRGATNAVIMRTESATSAPANRFGLGNDITLRPGMEAALICDLAATRWRAFNSGLLDHFTKRPCAWMVGSVSASAPPLAADEQSPEMCGNDYAGADWVIESFACRTDAGTTTVNPITTGGTTTSILSAPVVCTTAWTAGTINGTPTIKSFASNGATCTVTPCTLAGNFTAVDGTAKATWFKFGGRLQKP